MLKLLLSGLLLVCASLLQAGEPEPVALVRSTADYVLKQVSARKEELQNNPQGIYELVQEKVLPHFDFRVMARGALGRYWRQANDEQKRQITEQFKEMLVRTYATTLLNYADQKIEYLPYHAQPSDKRVMVATRIRDGAAPPVPINYRLYHKDGEWKVYDVVVDGVSLVSSYRNSFASQIRKSGIDGLIDSLRQHNQRVGGSHG